MATLIFLAVIGHVGVMGIHSHLGVMCVPGHNGALGVPGVADVSGHLGFVGSAHLGSVSVSRTLVLWVFLETFES